MNAVDQEAIDVLNLRLEDLKCGSLDLYHAVRNDFAELMLDWEQSLQDKQITERDCKSVKVWKDEIIRLFGSLIPGIITYHTWSQ